MPQTELKQYTDEIARLIDDGQVDAAIEHCRHILGFYPRYLAVYRLLAQASMEKGDYAHATHFLQSLLSADPENADAWADLAGLSDDLGELEQATWLMERAFEIEPGNADIRDRLRDLYKRRDGIDRPRLKLTPGALGRMYAVGGFHRRAIHELQRILESRPGLPPLHTAYLEVALARSFCSAQDMEDMAERVCHSLLDKLPNCLQANLMMGQILWSRGQAEDAEKHIELARALDPEGRTAQKLFGDRSPIPFERVEIPHLEVGEEATVVAPAQVPAAPVEDTSWLDQVGEAFAADVDLSESEAVSPAPSWLGEWSAEQTAPQREGEDAADQPPGDGPVGRTAPLPDWMLESMPEEGEDTGEDELPAWLSEDEQVEPLPAESAVPEAAPPAAPIGETEEEAELPAWLQELASEAEPAEEIEAVADEQDTTQWVTPTEDIVPVEGDIEPTETPGELAADELPDWLKAFDEESLDEGAEIEETSVQAFDEELPEWMQTPAPDTEEHSEEEQAQESELPDWLRSLERPAEEGAPVSGTQGPADAGSAVLSEEELPEWLRDLRERQPDLLEGEEESVDWVPEDVSEEELEIEALDTEELPDWLRELRAQGTSLEEPPDQAPTGEGAPEAGLPPVADSQPEDGSLREDELPSWLQELRAQDAASAPQSPEDLAIEGELPDWLREVEEEEAATEAPAERVDEEDLPDWLRELRAQEPISWEEDEQTLVGATAGDEPDWLAEIQAEDESDLSAEEIDQEALPDWLRELHAPESGLPAEEQEDAGAIAEGMSEGKTELVPDLEPAIDTGDEELPEWLRALRAAEVESESAPSITPEPGDVPSHTAEEGASFDTGETEATRISVEMPAPVEGMPAWLDELEAEIAGPPVEAPEQLGARVDEQAAAAGEAAQVTAAGAEPAQVELTESVPTAPAEPAEISVPSPVDVETAAEAETAGDQGAELELIEDVVLAAESEVVPEVAEVTPERETETTTAEAELPLEEQAGPPVGDAELPRVEVVEAEPVPEQAVEGMVAEGATSDIKAEEEPDWVRELEGPAVEGEPEASVEVPEVVPAPAPAGAAVEPSAAAPSEEPPGKAPVTETAQEHLSRARSLLADGTLDDAARELEQLVEAPSLYTELREELEGAIESNPQHAPLLRILGDVYVRTGELRKALEVYRQALHSLK